MEHYNEIKNNELSIISHKFAVKNIQKIITLLSDCPKGKEKPEKYLKLAQVRNGK